MEKKYKVYLFIIGILIISITIVLVNANKRSYYIVLEGENPIFLYEGSKYIEPGYSAFDSQGQDVTSKVEMSSNLNIMHEGEYRITYTIENKAEITRNIVVKEIIPEDLSVDFSLNGSLVQDIMRDSLYNEHGYKAIGNNGKDYSKYVTIEGIVDVHKVGTYQITYNLNVGSVHKKLNRTINVIGERYTLTLSNTRLTNKNVIITIKNNLKEFNHFLNPSDVEVKEEKVEFSVSSNGTYLFYMYDNLGNHEIIDVKITNIDKEAPIAFCKASVFKKNKTYTLLSEVDDIDKYVYDGKEYKEPKITVLNNNENDYVFVYDKAGNVSKILCEYDDVKKKGNIIANYSSDTLKYWVEKPTATYTITHVWVKDSYSQMKVAVNEKIGTLETANTILNREVTKYPTKGMIAINASAFVKSLTNPLVKYNDAWKNSTNAPIIIVDGEILRNFTGLSLPSTLYPVYGIKSNGYIDSFTFDGGSSSISKNKKTLDTMKESGIMYTFSFNPVLVINNKSMVNMTSKNIRQGLCQIDRNNFVIITNVNPITKRTKGMSFQELANEMVKLNCKFGINLDGGGSVNLYYKNKSADLKAIKNSNRKIADVIYFVEK